ncbi:phosphonate C-P lyase system protein PhnH [Thermus sp.]|uniref:phosphonate C-P lyase system protein PhnH n=1 Tax=Thermus sp. TaxID=275 RepID=UPI002615B58F|nr:phosphonate C-P lyase system protein PhnH [Thermus sp.]MCX7850798.1 phosphonate C-P lyase system protein PhnH [Thermus sp.]
MTAPFRGKERRTQEAFRSLLLALSYPGKAFPLPSSGPQEALRLLGETLLDGRVTALGPDWLFAALAEAPPRRAREPEEAEFAFLEGYTPALPSLLPRFPRGTPLEPEGGATLVLVAPLGQGQRARLRGPGIPGEREVGIGLPPAFWEARAACLAYPLGFELFLTDGRKVVGLPRTTEVEPWGT